MTPVQDDTHSRFYFPLRTNVSYFDNTVSISKLLKKIKQISLLYDEVYIERGLYQAFVAETGSFDFWVSDTNLNIPMLEQMWNGLQAEGGEFELSIAEADGEEYFPLISGPTLRHFYCEYHSLFKDVDLPKLPWIVFGSMVFSEQAKRQSLDLSKSLVENVDSIYPSITNRHLIHKIVRNLGIDLIASANLHSPSSVDTLFAPIISPIVQVAPKVAGFQVVAPDLSNLSWDVIADLRKEESLVNLRKQLLAWEQTASAAVAAGAVEDVSYENALNQAVINDLLLEIFSLQPKVGEVIGDVSLDLLLGPLTGASAIVTGLRGFGRLERASKSWIAAMVRLKGDGQA